MRRRLLLVNEERVAFITFTEFQCIGIFECVLSHSVVLSSNCRTQIVCLVRKLKFCFGLFDVLVIDQFYIVHIFS